MGAGLPFRRKRVAFYIAGELLAVGVTLPPSLRSAQGRSPRTVMAKVERVNDSDPVIAPTSNQTRLRIRLLGIDAPKIAYSR